MRYIITNIAKGKGRDGEKFYQVRLSPLRPNAVVSQEARRPELSIVDTSPDSIFVGKDVDDEIEIG